MFMALSRTSALTGTVDTIARTAMANQTAERCCLIWFLLGAKKPIARTISRSCQECDVILIVVGSDAIRGPAPLYSGTAFRRPCTNGLCPEEQYRRPPC